MLISLGPLSVVSACLAYTYPIGIEKSSLADCQRGSLTNQPAVLPDSTTHVCSDVPLEQQEPSQRRSWLYRFFSSGRSETLVSRWRPTGHHFAGSLGYLHIYSTALLIVLPATPI